MGKTRQPSNYLIHIANRFGFSMNFDMGDGCLRIQRDYGLNNDLLILDEKPDGNGDFLYMFQVVSLAVGRVENSGVFKREDFEPKIEKFFQLLLRKKS